MVFGQIKEISIQWFGRYDLQHLNYLIFILAWTWMLGKKYVQPNKMKLYYSSRCFLFLINFVLFLSMFSGMITERKEIENLSYSLSTSVFFVGSLLHFTSLVLKADELESCMSLLEHNFHLKTIGNSKIDLGILESGEKEIKSLSRVLWCFGIAALVTRGLCHLASTEKTSLLPFPYSDTVQSPDFEILFIYQFLHAAYFIAALVSSELVLLGFYIKIIKHFEILEKNIVGIQKIFEDTEIGERGSTDFLISPQNTAGTNKHQMPSNATSLKLLSWQKRVFLEALKDLIKHHQHILSLAKRVNAAIWVTLALQIVGGGLFLGFSFIVVFWESQKLSLRTVSQFIFSCGFLFNTFALCYYGSRMEYKCERAGEALYESSWHRMDGELRKNMVLFLNGLRVSPVPKAGNLMPLNLHSFLKLDNIIYNCMAIFQNVLNRNQPAMNS